MAPGRWLCQRQTGLGLAFGPLGEGLLEGMRYTPPRHTHSVPSVVWGGEDGHVWSVHLLPRGKEGAGTMPGSHLPTGLRGPQCAGLLMALSSLRQTLPPRQGWLH